MARVHINILGISQLKWTEMGEYTCYCGEESLRRNGVALIVNKRVWNAVLGCSLKNDRMISVSKANYSISQQSKSMLPPVILKKLKLNSSVKTSTRPSRTNTKKKWCTFHPMVLQCQKRRSRDTWSNRQVWAWRTRQSRSKANRVWPRESSGHSKNLFQPHKRKLYLWISLDD